MWLSNDLVADVQDLEFEADLISDEMIGWEALMCLRLSFGGSVQLHVVRKVSESLSVLDLDSSVLHRLCLVPITLRMTS